MSAPYWDGPHLGDHQAESPKQQKQVTLQATVTGTQLCQVESNVPEAEAHLKGYGPHTPGSLRAYSATLRPGSPLCAVQELLGLQCCR